MKKLKLIVLVSLLTTTLMTGTIASAEEKVVPGSIERDVVIRLSRRETNNVVNYYTVYRNPGLADRIEQYYDSGDATAVLESMAFLIEVMGVLIS